MSTRKISITRILGVMVMLLGVTVIVGWAANLPALTSIYSGWVTMKFATALSFALMGFGVIAASSPVWDEDGLLLTITGTAAVAVMFVMSGLALGLFSGGEFSDTGIKTVEANEPSYGTMLGFVLSSLALITFAFNGTGRYARLRRSIGPVLVVIASLALVGYATGTPALYYYFPKHSTGMAVHTALGFVALGVALGNLQRIKHK
ncbi:MAG: hypothetical protein ACPG77_17715 [Nannocystaceae bacterium]